MSIEEERRPYRILGEETEMGRTRVTILCPWCAGHVVAYVWSLAGTGKLCSCKAKFTWSDAMAIRKVMKS